MFKSLYESTQAKAQAGTASLHWPATYDGALEQLTPNDWSLTVSGAIEKPTRFVHRNILALPQVVQDRRLVSADGWTVKAQWQGVLLEELIKRIRPLSPEPDASGQTLWVHQESAGNTYECMALEDLLQGKALLCHKVNDQPLPFLYGGPVALLVFDRYQYKGLGQITSLTFSWEPAAHTTHTQIGYSLSGEIVPGDYYAFDLKAFRPLRGPEHFE